MTIPDKPPYRSMVEQLTDTVEHFEAFSSLESTSGDREPFCRVCRR